MRQTGIRVAVLAALLLLAGCGDQGSTYGSTAGTGNGVPPPAQLPKTRYDLANGCFALKSISAKTYAVHGADGAYKASSPNVAGAEPFFMKPTALGKYLFYAKDKSFLAVDGAAVGSAPAPSDAADWTIDTDASGNYTVFSASAGKALALAAGGDDLVLVGSADDSLAKFGFDPATGCAEFPEAQVNATGTPYKGKGVDQPVLGFADVHQHISATNFLGGAHYGMPFHRFGVTAALDNCEAAHGPDGRLDLVGNALGGNPLGTHDTQGWPTFVSWPERHSLLHENMYYKWIERTWRAGLRVLVNNLVENETLCNLQSKAPGMDPLQNCNEMDNAVAQVQFMHDLQDYIDAQEGGPGKGWFRIVTDPAEARRVINDGKLAVVLGLEISHLFNCSVQQVLGLAEVNGCTEADIDTQLERVYALGVRQMFPIHEFDNAFGGNGIFDGLVLNGGNFIDTGKFWATYDCPSTDPTGEFGDYFYSPGAIMTTSDPTGGADPLLDALLGPTGVVLPIYPGTRQCNARSLTPLGEYAFRKMMDKKVIMEVDHLELSIKDRLLDLAQAESPPYPVVSTHGGHGGISNDQVRRILELGGIVSPGGNTNGKGFTDTLNKLLPLKSPDHLFAMGFGADTNGLATQAGPRGADAVPVQYPFTLFQGPGWGPQFAGIAPVSFDREVSGERVFDINAEGWAHYGLAADFVDEVRIEGGEPALTALYNSAEAYLRMWEQTVNR
jgi:microsomal dipeptidase-like Zn-dependent dipeptidase